MTRKDFLKNVGLLVGGTATLGLLSFKEEDRVKIINVNLPAFFVVYEKNFTTHKVSRFVMTRKGDLDRTYQYYTWKAKKENKKYIIFFYKHEYYTTREINFNNGEYTGKNVTYKNARYALLDVTDVDFKKVIYPNL